MSDILYTISQRYNSFTHSHKIVANFMMENINNIAFVTLEDMAACIGVSTTTVIRFARNLGYNGYSDMQNDIQSSLRDKISLPARLSASGRHDINQNQLLQETFDNEIKNISNTLNNLSADDLERSINTILNADHIHILGLRGSYSLAVYTMARLGQIRNNVHLVHSLGMLFPEDLVGVKKGDVCLAFFFPRYSRSAANIIAWLKKKGVFVILVTNENYSIIASYGDIILPCYVKSNSLKNSYVAPMCLINYLVSAVTLKDYDGSMAVLEETEKFLSQGYFLGL